MLRSVKKWLWMLIFFFLVVFAVQIYVTHKDLPTDSSQTNNLVLLDKTDVHTGLAALAATSKGHNHAPTLTKNNSYTPKSQACTPRNHFAFIKLEKTGSTTIMMMLARYMLLHDLNLLGSSHPLPLHFDPSGGRDQEPGWTIGPRKDQLADVWMNHARYNATLIHNEMQPDTLVFTCIREPIAWFKSAVKYFTAQAWFQPRSKKNSSPDKVLDDDSLFYQNRTAWMTAKLFHNQQLLWLGLPYSQARSTDLIQKHVEGLTKSLGLVMINDQFDASLIMLKNIMCWTHKNILYTSAVLTRSSSTSMSAESVTRLLDEKHNKGDYILYQVFNETWWSRSETRDPAFWQEVDYFKKLNYRATGLCRQVLTSRKTYIIPANTWSKEIELTVQDCTVLGWREPRINRVFEDYMKRGIKGV